MGKLSSIVLIQIYMIWDMYWNILFILVEHKDSGVINLHHLHLVEYPYNLKRYASA